MTEVTGAPSCSGPAMDAATVSQLEFAQALEVVSRLALSEAGAERVCRRLPATSVDEVREELAAVAASIAGPEQEGAPVTSVIKKRASYGAKYGANDAPDWGRLYSGTCRLPVRAYAATSG